MRNKNLLFSFLAEAWLISKGVKEEYKDTLKPIIEKVYEFIDEYAYLSVKVKEGLGEEVSKIKELIRSCDEYFMEEKEKFKNDKYVLELLDQLRNEVKEVMSEYVLS